MAEHSIKYNFALNLTNTIVGFLFPLVTFPYVSRVLNPDGIGIVQFYQSVIAYIVLLTSLGIPLYAVREVAKVRHDEQQRNHISAEIITFHVLLSAIGYIVVGILCVFVQRIYEHLALFLLISSTIAFTVLGVAWFYQAVEDFRYITIRSLIVKTLCAISLFLFVKTKDDVMIYALILVLADVGSNIMNFLRLRKYFRNTKVKFSELKIMRHLRPTLRIFVLNLIISIYVQLNSVMLGFLSTDAAVGYFASATRITRVLLAVGTSLGAVLLPRMTNMIETGQFEGFKKLEKQALDFIFTISLPLACGLFLVAPQFVPVFSGDKFMPAVPCVEIMSPIVLFIGYSGMIAMQILYPQNKETLVIWSSSCGATINFILDLILIPRYQQNGAAIATLIAEFTVMTVMIIIGRKYLHYRFFNIRALFIVISTAVMALFVILTQKIGASWPLFTLLVTEICVGMLTYAVMLILFRNELAMKTVSLITSKLNRQRHTRHD